MCKSPRAFTLLAQCATGVASQTRRAAPTLALAARLTVHPAPSCTPRWKCTSIRPAKRWARFGEGARLSPSAVLQLHAVRQLDFEQLSRTSGRTAAAAAPCCRLRHCRCRLTAAPFCYQPSPTVQYILALKKCHKDHFVAKFWGECNSAAVALNICLKGEKATKR